MRKILLLATTIILSALSIITYDIYPDEPYNDSFDHLKLIGPGIFYSIFLTSFIKKNTKRIFLNYLLFVAIWIILYLLTYASWGRATPISGAVSGLIIGRIIFGLHDDYSLRRDLFLWIGAISSSAGFLIFLMLKSADNYTWGFSLMWIIVFWQLSIGILLIRNSR